MATVAAIVTAIAENPIRTTESVTQARRDLASRWIDSVVMAVDLACP